MGGGDLLTCICTHYGPPCDPALLEENYAEALTKFWIGPHLWCTFIGGNRQTRAAALGRVRHDAASGVIALPPTLVTALARIHGTRSVERPIALEAMAANGGSAVSPVPPVRPLSEGDNGTLAGTNSKGGVDVG